MVQKILTFLYIFQFHLLGFSALADNVTDVTQKSDFLNQQKAGEFFNKTNIDIHEALNEVFHLLRLPPESTENGTLKKLLTSYAGLKKVNMIGHKIYHDIEQLTRINKTIDNSTINFAVDLNELTLETLLNHLTKRVPKRMKYQDALKPKVEENNPGHTKATVKENNQGTQYLAAINVSHYQETNLLFSLDKITSIADDVWAPESEVVTKVRELFFGSRRINNGEARSIGQYSFVVSVQVDHQCSCGGSIVSQQMVLTAASCVVSAYRKNQIKHLAVRVGSSYCDKGGELISVVRSFFYPLFNPENWQNNLALLKLTMQLDLTQKTVKRIAMKFGNEELTGTVTLVGFGDMGQKDDDGVGDVGDPGVVNGKLVGVASLVSPACGHPAPTVFTRISDYQDWITRVIDDGKVGRASDESPRTIKRQLSYKKPGVTQILSALLLEQLLADDQKTPKPQAPHLRDYGDFRDWYDEQMQALETDHDRDPYHNPLVNQSILPIEYVLINSEERDEAIKDNYGRPVLDEYSTSLPTTTESTVEIYTSIVYVDDDYVTEPPNTPSVAHFTRLMESRKRKGNQKNERKKGTSDRSEKERQDDKSTCSSEGNYEGNKEVESEDISLDVAEINARI